MSRQLDRLRDEVTPIVPAFRAGRFIAQMTCSECGAEDEWTASSAPRPEVIRKKVADRGWSLGKAAVCSGCSRKGKPMATVTSIGGADKQVDGGAKAAERLFVRVMEDEAYDSNASRYKPGYSDKRMSDDLGLSEKHIATLRDRFFGPAGEPDEVTALRLRIDDLNGKLGTLRSDFDKMCDRNGFKR